MQLVPCGIYLLFVTSCGRLLERAMQGPNPGVTLAIPTSAPATPPPPAPAPATPPPTPSRPSSHSGHRAVAAVTVVVGMFLGLLNSTIVNSALPALEKEFNARVSTPNGSARSCRRALGSAGCWLARALRAAPGLLAGLVLSRDARALRRLWHSVLPVLQAIPRPASLTGQLVLTHWASTPVALNSFSNAGRAEFTMVELSSPRNMRRPPSRPRLPSVAVDEGRRGGGAWRGGRRRGRWWRGWCRGRDGQRDPGFGPCIARSKGVRN